MYRSVHPMTETPPRIHCRLPTNLFTFEHPVHFFEAFSPHVAQLSSIFFAVICSCEYDMTKKNAATHSRHVLICYDSSIAQVSSCARPIIQHIWRRSWHLLWSGATAGILAGAVAGDHASPISDTTILAQWPPSARFFSMSKLRPHMPSLFLFGLF